MRSKKTLALVAAFLLTASLFSGCGQKKDTTLVKIKLNEVVRSIFYAPMYVAINEGFFAEEGIEIELSTGQGADATYAKTQVFI